MKIKVRDLKELSFYYMEWEWTRDQIHYNYFKGICLYFRGELHDINSSDSWNPSPSADGEEISILEEL